MGVVGVGHGGEEEQNGVLNWTEDLRATAKKPKENILLQYSESDYFTKINLSWMFLKTSMSSYPIYADNPKISPIYVVRKLLGFKSDQHRV